MGKYLIKGIYGDGRGMVRKGYALKETSLGAAIKAFRLILNPCVPYVSVEFMTDDDLKERGYVLDE